MKNLTKLLKEHFKTNNQISGILFDSLAAQPYKIHCGLEGPHVLDATRHNIQSFITAVGVITEIGDIEHTSDWDPYLTITLMNGSTIQTDSGYYVMTIQGDNVLIEDSEDSDAPCYGEDIYWTIPLMEIRSIQLHR